MKHNLIRRLISLNLTLIMLFSLHPAPVSALFSETSSGAGSAYDMDLYAYQLQEIDIQCHGFVNTYAIGPIRIGDSLIPAEDVMTSTPIEGNGWSYILGELTLNEDYPGDPIAASGDLILRVEGDVTLRGTDGPAITAGEQIHFRSSEDGSLHLWGGTGSPAVSAAGSIQVESPLNLELMGDGCSALDSDCLGMGDLNYRKLAENLFLCNRLYTGSSPDDAILLPNIPAYIHDPTPEFDDDFAFFADIALYTPDITDPTDNYLRFEAVAPEDFSFTVYLDPQGGSVSDLASGEPCELSIPYTDTVTSSSYSTSTAFLTLPELPEPVRDGHLFLGWNTGPAYHSEEYYAENSELILTNQAADSLYAIWREIPESDYVILDGNGALMSSGGFTDSPRWILPLSDGRAELPDLFASAFAGWATAPVEPFSFWVEGLLQPRTTAELVSGTTLYAAYAAAGTPYQVYGNGYTTPAGNEFIQVTSQEPYTSRDLQRSGIFSAPGMALLDFSYSPSPRSFSFEADHHCYAQWTEAPVGSILLYSDGAATADGRYGKVISPDETDLFSLSDPNGFQRPGYRFAGWSEDGITILTQLPAPNEFGHIILSAVFFPGTVTYHEGDQINIQNVSDSGKATISSAVSTPAGQIFNGWNTESDGSGDWYLPGDVVNLRQALVLHAQYLDAPDDENWVLFEDPDGPALYIRQSFDRADAEGRVNVHFPACADSWISTTYKVLHTSYGYEGGQQYSVPTRSIFTSNIPGYQFHANGGLYPDSYPLRIERVYASASSLLLFPDQDAFEQIPANRILGGWSGDEVVTPSSTVYEPGAAIEFFYGFSSVSLPTTLYAVWDEADARYVRLNFSDSGSDRKESFSLRHKAGEVIALPTPASLPGYQFDGWFDGSTLFPAGSDYTVSDGDVTFTARWSEIPYAELSVPPEMRQTEQARIYLALYSESGRMCSITPVEPDSERVIVHEPPESAATYQFLCLSDDGTLLPLTAPARGDLP